MISSVAHSINGENRAFKLGARAMQAVENRFDQGIIKVFQSMDGEGYKMGVLAAVLAESAEDGRGTDDQDAFDMIDALGVEGANTLVESIINAAFPEAKGAAKNTKRAARSK